ncbi:hypothetical protein PGUG_00812 [Meyerozyma guilliermondii ATCC 6260]|uniref:Kinetochore-associated protein MTW1 n=1 Tax=Meyerozyma guilliermondii (strain ATCC 6260 / CBS 566 / DSM 6381 / JCM 1539 / NBRC 10279 / NRRL Y-324) TaxID=294746 RepID=A5DC07_PICGU|nr:uncharacterized protein PGUG_00812 [Meyerozyma guilliermondii ATCC 6260]EDK36714.2 hypothetical protein PGUG_00812 [Meyerozyma guilliermondii ATCC 6260]
MDYRVNALVTEHLGFPATVVIDDVINAVNEIMYKCVAAMDTFLSERTDKFGAGDKKIISEEIQIGTAKLETLLESNVDKNFDKFELYALRNIFTIPQTLVEQGYVRLKHHSDVAVVSDDSEAAAADERIQNLIKKINQELTVRKIIRVQVVKAKKIIALLRKFQACISALEAGPNNDLLSPEAKTALKSISPVDQTFHFLITQVDDLIRQAHHLHDLFSGDIQSTEFPLSSRDRYIQMKSSKLLERVGLPSSPGDTARAKIDNAISSTDLDIVNAIRESIEK